MENKPEEELKILVEYINELNMGQYVHIETANRAINLSKQIQQSQLKEIRDKIKGERFVHPTGEWEDGLNDGLTIASEILNQYIKEDGE